MDKIKKIFLPDSQLPALRNAEDQLVKGERRFRTPVVRVVLLFWIIVKK